MSRTPPLGRAAVELPGESVLVGVSGVFGNGADPGTNPCEPVRDDIRVALVPHGARNLVEEIRRDAGDD